MCSPLPWQRKFERIWRRKYMLYKVQFMKRMCSFTAKGNLNCDSYFIITLDTWHCRHTVLSVNELCSIDIHDRRCFHLNELKSHSKRYDNSPGPVFYTCSVPLCHPDILKDGDCTKHCARSWTAGIKLLKPITHQIISLAYSRAVRYFTIWNCRWFQKLVYWNS